MIGPPQRRAVEANGHAVMLEPIEQGVGQVLPTELLVPFGIVEVGGDDGRFLAVTLVQPLEQRKKAVDFVPGPMLKASTTPPNSIRDACAALSD